MKVSFILLLGFVALSLPRGIFSQTGIPGQAFIASGFDIAYGSTRPTSISEVTQSFSKPQIFLVEEGSLDVKPISVGELSISVSEAETLEKVTREFSADVKVGVSIPYFAFQGSSSFRQYSERLSSTYVKAYMARSIVGTSIIRLVKGRVNPEFLNDVSSLPLVYKDDPAIYLSFIQKWGTHYIESATMGGSTSFRTFTTKSQESELKKKSVNISLGIKIAFIVSVGGSASVTDSNYVEVTKQNIKVEAFGYGGNIGIIDNYTTWAATVAANPMPVTLELRPYIHLIADAERRGSLQTALQDYLFGSLVGQSALTLSEQLSLVDVYAQGANGAFPGLVVKRPNSITTATRLTESPYVANGLDSPMDFVCPGESWIMGAESFHNNGAEDRVWTFYCSNLDGIARGPCTTTGEINDWDGPMDYRAPVNTAIAGFKSYHNNQREDRRFSVTYCPLVGGTTDSPTCIETDYVNIMDGYLNYRCPAPYVMTGINSYHNNRNEDRRFKFRCCRTRAASGISSLVFSDTIVENSVDPPKFYTANTIPSTFPELPDSLPVLDLPVDYTRVWWNGAFGGISPLSFWRPVCKQGYSSMGHIVSNTYDVKPSLSQVVCVQDRCISECEASNALWAIGDPHNIYVFGKRSLTGDRTLNGFVSHVGNPAALSTQEFNCVKKGCITNTQLNISAVLSEVAGYWQKGFSSRILTDAMAPESKKDNVPVIVGSVMGVFGFFLLLGLAFAFFFFFQRRSQAQPGNQNPLYKGALELEPLPPVEKTRSVSVSESHKSVSVPFNFAHHVGFDHTIMTPLPTITKGTHVKAKFSGDGQYYPAVVDAIDDGRYLIRYDGFNDREWLPLQALQVDNDNF